ncbi:MAG: sigma 54-interacting transcriptional regulator [Zavarzinella sp.]
MAARGTLVVHRKVNSGAGRFDRLAVKTGGVLMASETTAYLVARINKTEYGEVYPLRRGVVYGVGRSVKNRIILPDDQCSRDHAELSYYEGNWYVRDLGSTNGTRVNNQLIQNDHLLQAKDRVQFGIVEYLFVVDPADLPPAGISMSTKQLEEKLEVTGQAKKSKFADPEADEEITQAFRDEHAKHAPVALYRLALQLGASKTIEQLSESVLNVLLDNIDAVQQAAILEVKPPRETRLIKHLSRDSKTTGYYKTSQLFSSETIDRQEAILANNILENPGYRNRDSITDMRIGSGICAPVTVEDTIVGLIHVYNSKADAFSEYDFQMTVGVAEVMAAVWGQLKQQELLRATNTALKAALKVESELVGGSHSLQVVEEQIRRVATTHATVLVRGESGSGKELVARAIHYSSPRKDGPYVTLNCAAITESLLESELFGHEKGAFTGATDKMLGKFETAHMGTIFLDEIGEMPLSIQAKFLRVLEGHPFERVGGNTPIKVNVRVVAATNRSLEQEVRSGNFRKDLFYRLQVVEIRVPPLRERLEDIPLLANHFLKRFVRETGRRINGFTQDAIDKLMNYNWPGNIRELRNVIERAVALNDKPMLDSSDIWLTTLEPTSSGGVPMIFAPISLKDMERRHIREMLRFTEWNKSKAAELLGIERSTLDRKIASFNIVKEESRGE